MYGTRYLPARLQLNLVNEMAAHDVHKVADSTQNDGEDPTQRASNTDVGLKSEYKGHGKPNRQAKEQCFQNGQRQTNWPKDARGSPEMLLHDLIIYNDLQDNAMKALTGPKNVAAGGFRVKRWYRVWSIIDDSRSEV